MKRIAILSSGNGTNAENLILHFKSSEKAKISLLIADKKGAFALKRAERENVPAFYIPRGEQFAEKSIKLLKDYAIDLVVLAGFLGMIPPAMVRQYDRRMVNLHPSLLPKYGGKGMYGENVHRAVIEAGEKLSGITIHYVNEEYDKGEIIFQAQCPVLPDDTPQSLANRIHALEYNHLPEVVARLIDETG